MSRRSGIINRELGDRRGPLWSGLATFTGSLRTGRSNALLSHLPVGVVMTKDMLTRITFRIQFRVSGVTTIGECALRGCDSARGGTYGKEQVASTAATSPFLLP